MSIRRKGICWLLLVMAIHLGACSTQAERLQKFMARGKTYYEQGDYVKALLELRNAITIDPECVEAYYLAGNAQLHLGKPKEAFAYFGKAAEKQPDHVGANTELAKFFLANRERDKAREKVDLVLSKDPGNLQALLVKGTILLEEEKALQVKELLEALLPQGAEEVTLYMLLARAHRQMNENEQVKTVLRQGCAKNPKSIVLHMALANFYAETDQLGEVEEELKQVCLMEPDKAEHVLRLAAFYWQAERKPEADTLLKGMVEKDNNNEGSWGDAAKFYLTRQQAEQTEKLLLSGLARHPKSFNLRFLLKDAYVIQGKVDKAIAVLLECLTIDKDNPAYVLAQLGLAELYYRVGNVDETESYLGAVLKKSPNNVDGHLLKGAVLVIKGEFDQAIAEYRLVLRERPRDILLYPRLADAFVRNRQNSLAIDTLKQGLQVAPDAPEVHRALARVYVIEKKSEEAEAQLQEIVDKQPDDLMAKIDLADFYLANNDKEKAEQIYKTVISRAPNNFLGYLKLSVMYAVDNNLGQAATTAAMGLAANPENNSLLEHCVQLYVKQDRMEEAIALTEQRLSQHPDDIFAYILQGKIHAERKEYPLAEQDYRKAMELNTELPEAAVSLAKVLVLAGNGKKAASDAEQLIATSSSSPALYLLLAELYELTERHDQALAVYDRALDKYPNNWFIMNNLVYFIADGPNPTAQELIKAETLAKKAQLLAPGNMAVLDTLGWLSFKMGKMVQARAALAATLNSNPNNPVFNYHMGMVLLKEGKKEEARSLLEKVVLSPGSFGERDEAEKILKELL